MAAAKRDARVYQPSLAGANHPPAAGAKELEESLI
jgi:hypothetical protein